MIEYDFPISTRTYSPEGQVVIMCLRAAGLLPHGQTVNEGQEVFVLRLGLGCIQNCVISQTCLFSTFSIRQQIVLLQ